MTSNTTSTHPAADLTTIVVDPDDVIESMRRNVRDRNEQLTHDLRINPPLEGEKTATPYITETNTRYPPEMDPKPVHIPPASFVIGHVAGIRHPDWRDACTFPIRHDQRSLFRDEHDLYDEHGNPRPMTDEEEADWADWWDTVVEVWEDHTRHEIETTDTLTLGGRNPYYETVTVSIRLADTDDGTTTDN